MFPVVVVIIIIIIIIIHAYNFEQFTFEIEMKRVIKSGTHKKNL